MPSASPARVRLGAARLQRLSVPSEPGLDVPAFLLLPAREVRGVLVAVDDRGKETLASDHVVETAVVRGWAVCGVDPRGIGESPTDKMGWIFAVSLLLGENFVGRQAWDLGRVLEALGAPDGFPASPSVFTPAARMPAWRPRTRSPESPIPVGPGCVRVGIFSGTVS